MCLITDKNLPIQTASEDMTVYKVFETTNNELHGPFYGDATYELGTESQTTLDGMCLSLAASGSLQICELTPDNPLLVRIPNLTYSSGRGFYSFTSMASAMGLIENSCLHSGLRHVYECFECTVPKGANYITDGDTVISDRIIPNGKTYFLTKQ